MHLRIARNVLDLLERIEDLPPDVAGELVLEDGGVRRGVVFVENGRVCWAAAPGLAQRLSDLLRAQTRIPISSTEMEALFRHGREHRKPLGELLVESGLMEADALLCALRRHTAESLLEIGKSSVVHRWVERAPGMYKPRFSLRPTELAACVGALLDDRDPRVAAASIGEHGIECGAVFARHGDAMLPIATAGVTTVRALRQLGVDAATRIEVASMLDGGTSFVFVGRGHGRGMLAFRDGPLLVVGRMHARADLVRSLGRLVAR